MSTFFALPHVDSDVTAVIKLLLGIENGNDNENLASLPATLLRARGLADNSQYMRVFGRLSEVNVGAVAAEDFVDWFETNYPGRGVWKEPAAEPQYGRSTMFSAHIANARKALGYTQADLASELGVAVSQVSRWESGGGQPSNATYLKLGLVLDTAPSVLWHMANMGAE